MSQNKGVRIKDLPIGAKILSELIAGNLINVSTKAHSLIIAAKNHPNHQKNTVTLISENIITISGIMPNRPDGDVNTRSGSTIYTKSLFHLVYGQPRTMSYFDNWNETRPGLVRCDTSNSFSHYGINVSEGDSNTNFFYNRRYNVNTNWSHTGVSQDNTSGNILCTPTNTGHISTYWPALYLGRRLDRVENAQMLYSDLITNIARQLVVKDRKSYVKGSADYDKIYSYPATFYLPSLYELLPESNINSFIEMMNRPSTEIPDLTLYDRTEQFELFKKFPNFLIPIDEHGIASDTFGTSQSGVDSRIYNVTNKKVNTLTRTSFEPTISGNTRGIPIIVDTEGNARSLVKSMSGNYPDTELWLKSSDLVYGIRPCIDIDENTEVYLHSDGSYRFDLDIYGGKSGTQADTNANSVGYRVDSKMLEAYPAIFNKNVRDMEDLFGRESIFLVYRNTAILKNAFDEPMSVLIDGKRINKVGIVKQLNQFGNHAVEIPKSSLNPILKSLNSGPFDKHADRPLYFIILPGEHTIEFELESIGARTQPFKFYYSGRIQGSWEEDPREKKELIRAVLKTDNGVFFPVTIPENIIMNEEMRTTLADFVRDKESSISWVSTDPCPIMLNDGNFLSGDRIYNSDGKEVGAMRIPDYPVHFHNSTHNMHYNRYTGEILYVRAKLRAPNTTDFSFYKGVYSGPNFTKWQLRPIDTTLAMSGRHFSIYPIPQLRSGSSTASDKFSTQPVLRFQSSYRATPYEGGGWILGCAYSTNNNPDVTNSTIITLDVPENVGRFITSLYDSSAFTIKNNFFDPKYTVIPHVLVYPQTLVASISLYPWYGRPMLMGNNAYSNSMDTTDVPTIYWSKNISSNSPEQVRKAYDYRAFAHNFDRESRSNFKPYTFVAETPLPSKTKMFVSGNLGIGYERDKYDNSGKLMFNYIYTEFNGNNIGNHLLSGYFPNMGPDTKFKEGRFTFSYNIGSHSTNRVDSDVSMNSVAAHVMAFDIYKDYLYTVDRQMTLRRFKFKLPATILSTGQFENIRLESDSGFGEHKLPFRVNYIQVNDNGVLCSYASYAENNVASYFYRYDSVIGRKIHIYQNTVPIGTAKVPIRYADNSNRIIETQEERVSWTPYKISDNEYYADIFSPIYKKGMQVYNISITSDSPERQAKIDQLEFTGRTYVGDGFLRLFFKNGDTVDSMAVNVELVKP